MSDRDPPTGFWFEDIELGWSMRTSGRTIRDHEISTFVNLAGFTEPLFLDDRHAVLPGNEGRRLVPAALVYSLAEGLVMQTNVLHYTGIAFLGAELDVRAPTFVGDTIEVDVTVSERRLASRGDRGLVRTQNVVRRGDDVVLDYQPLRIVWCRGHGPHAGAGG